MMAMMNIERQMELPTPRSMARTSYRVHVWCKACRHARDADLGALNCGSRLTDFVVVGSHISGRSAPIMGRSVRHSDAR